MKSRTDLAALRAGFPVGLEPAVDGLLILNVVAGNALHLLVVLPGLRRALVGCGGAQHCLDVAGREFIPDVVDRHARRRFADDRESRGFQEYGSAALSRAMSDAGDASTRYRPRSLVAHGPPVPTIIGLPAGFQTGTRCPLPRCRTIPPPLLRKAGRWRFWGAGAVGLATGLGDGPAARRGQAFGLGDLDGRLPRLLEMDVRLGVFQVAVDVRRFERPPAGLQRFPGGVDASVLPGVNQFSRAFGQAIAT